MVAAQQETLERITTRANNPFCIVILVGVCVHPFALT